MRLDIQYKIKSNPDYQRFIRENSVWYKILLRNPQMMSEFINEVKTAYKLHATDKIERMVDTVSFVSSVLNAIK
jgi:hypothetical protein